MLWLSPIKKVLLLAAVIYFLLASLTHHPDNKLVLHWAGLEGGRVLDIWKYGEAHFPGDSQFNYPPTHYALDKIQYFMAKVIGGEGYDQWLSSPNSQDEHQPNLARYALATKTGLILVGLLLGYLIYLLALQKGASEKQALVATCLWFFNPITLYSLPIMGQNDVLALVFFVGGWFFIKKKWWLAAIMFGLGASVKTFPLIWLPFLLVATYDFSWKKRFLVMAGAVGTYLLTLAPFFSNPWFRDAVLDSNLNDRFLYAQIGFGYAEAISIIPILLLLVMVALFTKKHLPKFELAHQSFVLMVVNLLMLGFTHFHPQWWTWAALFWSIWFVFQRPTALVISSFLSFICFMAWLVVVVLFEDAYLTFALLMPLNPALANIPLIRQMVTKAGVNVIHYLNLAHTWLAAVSITSLAMLLKDSPLTEENHLLAAMQNPRWPVLKLAAWLRKSAVAGVAVVGFFCFALAAYVIPAPLASKSPTIKGYEPIYVGMIMEWTEVADNFDRLDLYFRNPDLKNNDNFRVDLRNEKNELVLSQTFSAFNAGDPAQLRFNFPPQSNSKGQHYHLAVLPIDGARVKEESLLIGVTDLATPSGSVAVKTFYRPENFAGRMKNGIAAAVHVVKQVPWLYAVLLVILVLIA